MKQAGYFVAGIIMGSLSITTPAPCISRYHLAAPTSLLSAATTSALRARSLPSKVLAIFSGRFSPPSSISSPHTPSFFGLTSGIKPTFTDQWCELRTAHVRSHGGQHHPITNAIWYVSRSIPERLIFYFVISPNIHLLVKQLILSLVLSPENIVSSGQ